MNASNDKSQQNYISESDEINLQELILKLSALFKYILAKWKLIFLISFITALIGIFYAILNKPIYKATLTFAVEDEKGGGGGLTGALGLASTFGIDLGGGAGSTFSGSNLIELIKSRKMVEQALLKPILLNEDSVCLINYYFDVNGWRSTWKKRKDSLNRKLIFPIGMNRKNFSLQQDSILARAYEVITKNSLSVFQKDKKVSFITIEMKSINESFSKLFVETLIQVVSDFYIETKSKKAKTNFLILEKQTDSIRNELNNAISGVAIANDKTYNLNPALNVNRVPSTRRQVDIQANTAILTELVKNLELAKVTLRKETPLIQIIDAPIKPLPKEQFGKLKSGVLGGVIGALFSIVGLLLRRWWGSIKIGLKRQV